jgi:thymidylate kinase
MNGIIILEGADGVGKTTLAQELKRRFGGHYVHLRRHKVLFNWWFAALSYARKRKKESLVVIDRHWPSHLIYQSVYDDCVHLDSVAPTAHTMFTKLGGIYVFCVPSDIDSVVRRHAKLAAERVEMYSEGMDKVAVRYKALWEGRRVEGMSGYFEDITRHGGVQAWPNAVRYEVGVTSYEEVIHNIVKAQNRIRTRK